MSKKREIGLFTELSEEEKYEVERILERDGLILSNLPPLSEFKRKYIRQGNFSIVIVKHSGNESVFAGSSKRHPEDDEWDGRRGKLIALIRAFRNYYGVEK